MLLVDVPSPAGFDAAPPPRALPKAESPARPDTPSHHSTLEQHACLQARSPPRKDRRTQHAPGAVPIGAPNSDGFPNGAEAAVPEPPNEKAASIKPQLQRRILQRRRIPRPPRFLRCCASRPFCGCSSLSMRTPVLAAVAAAVAVPRLRPLPPNCAPPPDGIVPAPPDTPPSSEERTPRTRPPTFGNPGPGPRQKST